MLFIANLDIPELKRYTRSFDAGERPFSSGDAGSTMFVVIKGIIGLYDTGGGTQRLVASIGSGQVFGEQAIVGEPNYRRAFTAEAVIETTVLEVGAQDLREIEVHIPDFTLRILQITAKWMSRMNRQIEILRPMVPAERLVRCLEFLSEEKKGRVKWKPEELHYLTHLDLETLDRALGWMESQGLVKQHHFENPSEIRSRIIELGQVMS